MTETTDADRIADAPLSAVEEDLGSARRTPTRSPMNTPVPTTSAIYPVRLREDLPREVACSYWAGRHAELVRRLPHLIEYNQHHFSATDHGYWPPPRASAPPSVPPGGSTGSRRC